VQTLDQIEVALLYEIDHYELPDRTEMVGLVGTAWTSDRYIEEIRKMRECLVKPYWCSVRAGDPLASPNKDVPSVKTFAAVAKDDGSGYFLLYDPVAQTYALGWADGEGQISTFMYGDAVSTFLAR
jgi:hypothetical protein